MFRSALILGLAGLAGCVPAREDGARRPAAREARPAASSGGAAAEAVTALAAQAPTTEASADVQVRYDLVAHAQRADVRRGALLIDVGSAAAAKYTLGGWHTGWGRDRQEEGATVATPVERARLYFGADQASAGVIRIRGKGGPVRLTLNDEPLETIDLSGSGFRTGEVSFPERALHAGENVLAVRGETARIDRVEIATGAATAAPAGADAAAGAGASAGGAEVPTAESLVTRALLGSVEVPALRLPGGTTLSYTIEVPSAAALRLAVSATQAGAGATVRVRVARDGQAPEELLAQAASTGAPVGKSVDLSRFAGEVVRLDLQADGPSSTEAVVVAPRVVDPRPATPPRGTNVAKNVLVVLVDTLRADKLRPYNPRSRVVTESFDRLVREGTTFEQASPQENWTKPSVATLLTGLYPSTHNTKGDASVLPGQALMLSEVLQDAGFETGAFIANGYVSDRFGFNQGWQSYRNYVRQEIANKAEFVARDVLEWIDHRNTERRFFLYVHAIDPHVPYSPPVEYIRRYDPSSYTGRVRASQTAMLLEDIKTGRFDPGPRDRERLEALYDGEVTYNDERMNAVFEGLASRDLLDDTLVVYTSDHGEEFFDHGSVGHGHSLFRELLHVPLVMRLPGRIPAGGRVPGNVGLVDVMPTVLELLGVDVPPSAQGRSLVGRMSGTVSDAPDGALSEFLDTQRALTSGRFKLVQRGLNPVVYDLQADPTEQRNVAESRPIVLRHLRALMGLSIAGADTGSEAGPRRPRRALPRETTTIDPETEAQLRALGYVGTSRPQ